MKETEKRCYSGQEFRTIENEQNEKYIEGHAAVFEQKVDICDCFFEVIDRNAFSEESLRDVALFVNHECNQIPLARSRQNDGKSTMTLSIDDIGLAIKAKLDTENNPTARALYSSVARGDIAGMSFSFRVEDEEWQNLDSDMPTRRIKKISRVYEVSAVSYPAYEGTDISARAHSTLENARKSLDKAKAQKSKDDKANEIEILRLKNKILGGI